MGVEGAGQVGEGEVVDEGVKKRERWSVERREKGEGGWHYRSWKVIFSNSLSCSHWVSLDITYQLRADCRGYLNLMAR